jgi:non-lysosomal glucosylceramidase
MKKSSPLVIGLIIVFGFVTASKYLAGSAKPQAKHLVPADKKLPKQWIQRLFERGQPETYSGQELDTIGMPVGGIATGQLYLRGDGTLGLWWIFNKHVFTGYGATCYRTYTPESPLASGFSVIVKGDDLQWVGLTRADFPDVEFAGEYPIAAVRYAKKGFPLEVQMEAFSPFIPLNAKDSALPATLFHITLTNVSDAVRETTFGAFLENPVLFDSAQAVHALRRSRIIGQKGRVLLIHTAEEAPKSAAPPEQRPKIVLADFEGPDYGEWKVTGEAFGKQPARGTLPTQQTVSGFSGEGLVNTFLGGDGPQGTLTSPSFRISRKFINFLIGGGNHAGRTCINLLIDDELVRTTVGKNNEKLERHFWNVQEFEGKQAQIEILDRVSGGWGHINIDQIELSDEPHVGPTGPIDKLADYGSIVLAFDERPWPQLNMNISAIPATGGASQSDDVIFGVAERRTASVKFPAVKLAPGQKHTYTVVLAWFFPNHPHGHEYANRFKSAGEVAHYVLDNHDRLAGDTRKWCQTFYEDSTLPRWLLFRLHSTVCNLATGTCQWWENGRFWAWEGVGCCAGTCTHVWNYAHAPARLFPELERAAREMQDFGEGFDAASGLVGFRSNRAYAADGQCGTVLKAYREHQMSADNTFLKRNWPRIKKALLFSISRDENDDGLIEVSQHNTYDINFEGANTFVGSLYLAALRAGEEMAREMGDDQFAKRCRRIFESGAWLSTERLWNGEYFIQRVDLKKYPKDQYGEGCLSDQLFGQGWAHHLGLGYIYPAENVRKALESVWKYNWAPDIGPYNVDYKPERWFARAGEPGLFTCTWPKSPYLPAGVRYKNEVWTGIEYQVAGHMVWEGMVEEAFAICDGVHKRYHPAKHNPFNEVECGDHYARAMASWGVYTALAGYEYHGPKGHIGFAPKVTPEDFRAAFTAAEGWGLFSQKRDKPARPTSGGQVQREQIEVRWGQLGLKSLAFGVREEPGPIQVSVAVAGKPLDNDFTVEDSRVDIRLKKRLVVSEGQTLEVVIHQSQ